MEKPRAYYWKEGDQIIVQNVIGGFRGQEHKHTPESFENWKEKAKGWELIKIK